MGIVKQKLDGKGSLKDIQLLVNNHSFILNKAIIQKDRFPIKGEIKWLSPLAENDFSEYSDEDFIKLLELNITYPLKKFWPKRGPQWDALGISRNNVFLVEAKANLKELKSPASIAGPKSKLIIDEALNATKQYLQIKNNIDWSGKYYQYTNRLAHLYFFRVLNGVDAYLVNIYFLNDKEVKGPKTKEEWEAAILVMKTCLGIGRHKFDEYIIDVYIDVEEMK